MFIAFKTIPAVQRGMKQLKGTRHMNRYFTRAWIFATLWFSLLVILIAAVFASKFWPRVYQTVHIALIVNNFIQLINTLQFYAAFQLLRGLEFMLSIGTRRKVIQSYAITENSASDCVSDMVVDTGAKDLYSAVDGISSLCVSGQSKGKEFENEQI